MILEGMSTVYYDPVSDHYWKSFAYKGKKTIPRIDPRKTPLANTPVSQKNIV